MQWLYLLTSIIYILLFTILKRWQWGTAKYSYPCMLRYYRKNDMFGKSVARNEFGFDCLLRPIGLKQLNSLTTIETLYCFKLSRGHEFDSRFWLHFLLVLLFLCFTFLVQIITCISWNFAVPFAMLFQLVNLTYWEMFDQL